MQVQSTLNKFYCIAFLSKYASNNGNAAHRATAAAAAGLKTMLLYKLISVNACQIMLPKCQHQHCMQNAIYLIELNMSDFSKGKLQAQQINRNNNNNGLMKRKNELICNASYAINKRILLMFCVCARCTHSHGFRSKNTICRHQLIKYEKCNTVIMNT